MDKPLNNIVLFEEFNEIVFSNEDVSEKKSSKKLGKLFGKADDILNKMADKYSKGETGADGKTSATKAAEKMVKKLGKKKASGIIGYAASSSENPFHKELLKEIENVKEDDQN